MNALRSALIRGTAPLMLEARHYHKTQSKAANGDMGRTVTKVQSVLVQRDISRLGRRVEEGIIDKTARFIMLQQFGGVEVVAPVEGDTFKLLAEGTTWTIGDAMEDAASSHWILDTAKSG